MKQERRDLQSFDGVTRWCLDLERANSSTHVDIGLLWKDVGRVA